MPRLVVVCVAVAAVLAGCADIGDFDTVRRSDRLPSGAPERIRILAPIEPAVGDEIVAVRVERLAQEADEPGTVGRERCVIVRVTGAGRIVDFAASTEELVIRNEVRFLLDRGRVQTVGVVGTEPGTALLWARLLDSSCPGDGGAASLAEASRTLRFDDGGLLPLAQDGGP